MKPPQWCIQPTVQWNSSCVHEDGCYFTVWVYTGAVKRLRNRYQINHKSSVDSFWWIPIKCNSVLIYINHVSFCTSKQAQGRRAGDWSQAEVLKGRRFHVGGFCVLRGPVCRSASSIIVICCLTPPGPLPICACGTVPLLGPEMVFQRRSESFFGADGLIVWNW